MFLRDSNKLELKSHAELMRETDELIQQTGQLIRELHQLSERLGEEPDRHLVVYVALQSDATL